MTKPKGMSAEQEAEWKAKKKRYLAEYSNRPDAKEKAKARTNRYREKPGIRARDNAKLLEKLRTDPELKAREDQRKADWAKSETGAQKGREWAHLYRIRKREEKQFDAFMAALETEEGE